MLRVRTILFPTDFSSYSNQAYLHAVAIAERHKASMTIVYVAGPEQKEGESYWRGQLEQIRPANRRIAVNHVYLEGDPASEIVQYARDARLDLIVMGTHGRTGIDRLVLGSVAEKVLRNAPCSVLVVKLPKGMPHAGQPEVALAASR